MDPKTTGQKIASIRKEKGLTQGDLARSLCVSVAAVSKWERGLNFPDLTLLEPLAETLDTSAAELLGLQNSPAEEIIRDLTVISEEERAKSGFRFLWRSLLVMVLAITVIPLGLWLYHGLYDSGVPIMSVNVLWPLGFGILSWSLGLLSLITTKCWTGLFCWSWALCALAIYFPVADVARRVAIGDLSGVIDTALGWHQGTVILLTGTAVISAVSWFLYCRRKK